MQRIGGGQQRHIGCRIGASKPFRRAVAGGQRCAVTRALDQACELLARIAADVFEKTQYHRFVHSSQPGIAEPPQRALNEGVALVRGERERYRCRARQKGRQIGHRV